MEYCSRRVSGQVESIHPLLTDTVRKHLQHPYQRPVQSYNQAAMDDLVQHWGTMGKPAMVLDSGCGTGASTRNLSRYFPDHLVIGIDQSRHRLARSGVTHQFFKETNYCLIRADLVDCWRLLRQLQLPVSHHFILYPNPWPKKKHLQRRWHGHPVFADLIRLSPRLELRSNWKSYVDEFDQAIAVAMDEGVNEQFKSTGTQPLQTDHGDFLTPFEKKYALSGQTLYRLTVA